MLRFVDLWLRDLVFNITAQLHSTRPNLRYVQVQILFATCWRSEMVRISDNGFSWKYHLKPGTQPPKKICFIFLMKAL